MLKSPVQDLAHSLLFTSSLLRGRTPHQASPQPPLTPSTLLVLAFLAPDQCPGPQFAFTVIAILLHFLYLCTFSWALLEALHLYRALTEVRDVNASPMRFYYMLGWGVPAFITGTLPPFLAWRSHISRLESMSCTPNP